MRILQYDTYLAIIRGSEGSVMFRTLWATVDGERRDITQGGLLSCAFYVSSILAHFKLVESPHATVSGLVRDLERSGWRPTATLIPGCVLVWEKAAQAGGEEHLHAGFYLGNDEALSHSDKTRTPARHHVTFNGTRNVLQAYTHDFLNS